MMCNNENNFIVHTSVTVHMMINSSNFILSAMLIKSSSIYLNADKKGGSWY